MKVISSFGIKAIIIFIIVSSCKKEIVYEGIEGDLKGFVSLSDNFVQSDHSGVEVMVDGASSGLKTTTNSKGEYSFSGLKTGIYDLVFTKPGYSTYKHYSLQFLGGNIPYYAPNAFLYILPTVTITSLKVDTGRYNSWSNPYVKVTVAISEPSITYLRYYADDTPDVSYIEYRATGNITVNGTYSGGYPFQLQAAFLSKLPKGKPLYFIIYPAADGSSYIDGTTGNQIYPVNPEKASARIPFTIPKPN